MVGWTVVLIALWCLLMFSGYKHKTEQEKWRTDISILVLTICITIIMVWGDF